jgi:hypothetical protein
MSCSCNCLDRVLALENDVEQLRAEIARLQPLVPLPPKLPTKTQTGAAVTDALERIADDETPPTVRSQDLAKRHRFDSDE